MTFITAFRTSCMIRDLGGRPVVPLIAISGVQRVQRVRVAVASHKARSLGSHGTVFFAFIILEPRLSISRLYIALG